MSYVLGALTATLTGLWAFKAWRCRYRGDVMTSRDAPWIAVAIYLWFCSIADFHSDLPWYSLAFMVAPTIVLLVSLGPTTTWPPFGRHQGPRGIAPEPGEEA